MEFGGGGSPAQHPRLKPASLSEKTLRETSTRAATEIRLLHAENLKQLCMCTKCTRQNGQLHCRDIEAECNQGTAKGPNDVYVKCVSSLHAVLTDFHRTRFISLTGQKPACLVVRMIQSIIYIYIYR